MVQRGKREASHATENIVRSGTRESGLRHGGDEDGDAGFQMVFSAEVRTPRNRDILPPYWEDESDRSWECTSQVKMETHHVLLNCSA